MGCAGDQGVKVGDTWRPDYEARVHTGPEWGRAWGVQEPEWGWGHVRTRVWVWVHGWPE